MCVMDLVKLTAKEQYAEKLKDARWRERRLKEIATANRRCEMCHASRFELHVHHVRYVDGVEPWDADQEDLCVVCEHCHAIVRHCIEAEQCRSFKLVLRQTRAMWKEWGGQVDSVGDSLFDSAWRYGGSEVAKVEDDSIGKDEYEECEGAGAECENCDDREYCGDYHEWREAAVPVVESVQELCPKCGSVPIVTETKHGARADCCGMRSWRGAPLVSTETMNARQAAHKALKPWYDQGGNVRSAAYVRLAEEMGLSGDMCHIKLMDAETARRVVEVVKQWK